MTIFYAGSEKSAISQTRSRPAFVTLFPRNISGPDGLKLMVAVDQIASVMPSDDGLGNTSGSRVTLKHQLDAWGTPFHRHKSFDVSETFEQIENLL